MTYHDRHECKFVVAESVAARVLQRVAPHVVPDPFAAARPGHTYTIASLYLDDPNASLYRETIEGRAHRYKLRVRAYDDDPAVPVFVEVKRRHDRVVQKLRCPVPRDRLAALLAGQDPEIPGLTPIKRRSLEEFARLVRLRRAVPRCTVRYERQAWVGRDDDEVRVTFDRRLCALPEREPRVRVHDARYATVPMGGVVLELKFCERCPPWLLETMRVCELRRRSFSKYCTAVDAMLDARQAGTG